MLRHQLLCWFGPICILRGRILPRRGDTSLRVLLLRGPSGKRSCKASLRSLPPVGWWPGLPALSARASGPRETGWQAFLYFPPKYLNACLRRKGILLQKHKTMTTLSKDENFSTDAVQFNRQSIFTFPLCPQNAPYSFLWGETQNRGADHTVPPLGRPLSFRLEPLPSKSCLSRHTRFIETRVIEV